MNFFLFWVYTYCQDRNVLYVLNMFKEESLANWALLIRLLVASYGTISQRRFVVVVVVVFQGLKYIWSVSPSVGNRWILGLGT